MKFLFVADLHHPEELAEAQRKAAPGETLLFPPSQGPYFWTRALRKAGHQVEAFIRNIPAVFGSRAKRSARFSGAKTISTLFTVLGSRLPTLHPDFRIRNRRLIDQVARYRPDVIMLSGGNQVIYPETLAQIKREFGTRIVYLTGVSPIVFSLPNERRAANLYDLVIVNDLYHGIQWLELGAPRMEVLPMSACDPDYHRSYALSDAERAEYACEIGFVGTLLPLNLYADRVLLLEAVRDLGLGIWSIHAVPGSLRDNYRGPALGEKMLRILCGSKIQVNPHGNFMRYGGNMRLFEAAGCGVFQITDDRPGIPTWFTPGQHIVTFRDGKHLRELAQYYLRHDDERQRIAAAAQAHVYAHHTYDHRMKALVDMLA